MVEPVTAARRTVRFARERLTIMDIVDVGRAHATVELSPDPAFRAFIQRGADFIDRVLAEDGVIYGVTTGYGDSCTVVIPADLVDELPRQLYTFHGVGLGAFLTPEETRAAIATRLASLSRGYSGVSIALLDQLSALLRHDILPLIPAEGSVGASGDLTPLSYVAAVMCGEREVLYQGRRVPAAEALAAAGLTPMRLRPKECLALVNGTAVMTGIACLAWARAEYLARLATRITAMASIALDGNAHHFDETLFSVKQHAGQQRVAGRIREDLASGRAPRNERRLQDRYSIRCAPHVIGVLDDALAWTRDWIETELNSTNDNPMVDAVEERVLHGGNFYGGHIAFAMDCLKQAVANVADLLDRQLALLVDPRFNHGLPANLSGATGPRAVLHHGLKALQIGVSAWTAEALEAHDARLGVLALHRVPQSGQGEHGNDRGAGCGARARVERAGSRGVADRRLPGGLAPETASGSASHQRRRVVPGTGGRAAARRGPRPGWRTARTARAHPTGGVEPL